MLDFREARDRRRFYLDRGFRKRSPGAGSDLQVLMQLPREAPSVRIQDLFGDVPAMVIGGVATRAYAPERATKDTDFMVEFERLGDAEERLLERGWRKIRDLFFPNASLGLRGSAWQNHGSFIDVVATDQEWGREAFRKAMHDQTGLRVIPLPFLVLMKIDSARGVDQGDLTRMLGRLDHEQVETIAALVDRYAHDPQAAEDVRQYARLGQLEWDSPQGDGLADPI